jgi:hypothetical protein
LVTTIVSDHNAVSRCGYQFGVVDRAFNAHGWFSFWG